MILNQWVCPFADGHWPKLCPSGQPLVAFGGGATPSEPPTVRVMNWRTGALLLEFKGGRAPHWLTDSIVTFLKELAPGRDQRWEFDTATNRLRETGDDPSLVAANEFSAGGGHWASYLANPRRVVVDGKIHPESARLRGVSVSGDLLLTAFDDALLQFYDISTLARTRTVTPAGTFNLWRNCYGIVFHGYWGDTFAAAPGQISSFSQTIAPWHAEGVAVGTFDDAGRVWVATATEIAPSTKESRVGVLVRPFGTAECLALWDVEANTLDLEYASGRLILAAASTRGELKVIELDERAPLQPVSWPMDRPLDRAVAWGAYFDVTSRTDYQRNGTTLPSANCYITVDPGDVELAGDRLIMVNSGNLDRVTRPDKVVAFIQPSESSDVNELNAVSEQMRSAWKKKFPGVHIPPVVGYLQPKQVEHMGGAFPNYDIFAPQIYFELGETPVRIDYFYWMNYWLKRLPNDRLWMPTVQAYDRNFTWNQANMTTLSSQQGQLISLAREYQFITGYCFFAVNRPGGVKDWSQLKEALKTTAGMGGVAGFPSRWPYRPAEPVDPVDPPDPEEEGMTADDIRRYIAELPNDILFGAYQRLHDEVLPRDRPKEGVIKAADDSDMWTGDVITGGANALYNRSYIAEYIIARDKGRNAAQASGDGHDAGMRAYNQAVGRPQ